MTRAADDYDAIRARLGELRGERRPDYECPPVDWTPPDGCLCSYIQRKLTVLHPHCPIHAAPGEVAIG